VILDVQI